MREAAEILDDDEFPENGLKSALILHLLTSAHIILSGGTVCNFLIHPSMKTDQHKCFAGKIDYPNLNFFWQEMYSAHYEDY